MNVVFILKITTSLVWIIFEVWRGTERDVPLPRLNIIQFLLINDGEILSVFEKNVQEKTQPNKKKTCWILLNRE